MTPAGPCQPPDEIGTCVRQARDKAPEEVWCSGSAGQEGDCDHRDDQTYDWKEEQPQKH